MASVVDENSHFDDASRTGRHRAALAAAVVLNRKIKTITWLCCAVAVLLGLAARAGPIGDRRGFNGNRHRAHRAGGREARRHQRDASFAVGQFDGGSSILADHNLQQGRHHSPGRAARIPGRCERQRPADEFAFRRTLAQTLRWIRRIDFQGLFDGPAGGADTVRLWGPGRVQQQPPQARTCRYGVARNRSRSPDQIFIDHHYQSREHRSRRAMSSPPIPAPSSP